MTGTVDRQGATTPGDPAALLAPLGEPASASRGAVAEIAALAGRAGLRRVHMLAWRDRDDPEAGGSELHAHRVASIWAAAGLDVTMRTSMVAGQAEVIRRNGYRVIRRSGRYGVFARAALERVRAPLCPGDALVDIWNGMPFFSPLWYRGPRVTFLHHVHAEMWRMALPGALGAVGEQMERVVAPRVYRTSRIVTLSESSRREIITMMGLRPEQVSVAPPGVEPRFAPGGVRAPVPTVVAVGRLVPVKRFHLLIDALARVRETHPDLHAVIIGEGAERSRLEDLRASFAAEHWLDLPGSLSDQEVVEWYRRAWVVASSSLREGWGMTITEAGACGTPAVATRIAGHLDAVDDGRSGLLVSAPGDLPIALDRVLSDSDLRSRLGQGALAHARQFTWVATARSAMEALVEQMCPTGR